MADINEQPAGAQGAPVETAGDGSVDWGGLALDMETEVGDDGAFVIEPEAPTANEPELPQAAAQLSPTAQSSSQPSTPPQSASEPTAQAPSSQSPQPQAPVQQPTAPQQTAQQPAPAVDPAELRANYIAQLTNVDYAISQEDAIALATQPETVMPRLAANLHMRVMQDVTRHVQQMMSIVPTMLSQQVEQDRREAEAKQEFYNEWPGLSTHHELVLRNAAMVRQSNPQATREQVINMAGALTAMALGVDPASVRKAAQGQAIPAHVPAAAPRQPRPPRPAAPGSAPTAAPLDAQSVWAQFADEDNEWMR